MKQILEIIIYPNNEEKQMPIRAAFDLGGVTAEEFDPSTHNGKVFLYPEFDISKGPYPNQFIYIWKVCYPDNEEEKRLLVEMGKYGYTEFIKNNQ